MLASIRESNAIVNSTKPTEFQQQLNAEAERGEKPGIVEAGSLASLAAPNTAETYTSDTAGYGKIVTHMVYNKPPLGTPTEGYWITSAATKTCNKAETYDEGKLPLAWLPWAAIDELSKVQQYGHAKYKDFNNYRKGMEVSRNLSCALRHIRDFLEGHDVDAESGHSPLAHALCRIAFVLQNLKEGTAIDDRYKP